ncbi:unnamed protein product [Caenorhabditis angaria]|uniref:Sidoreflexin n=1 Tax=Caenorhabditis angaria TaxID=860376 RepID=A0A9P1N0K0_9PELO|nr:unnamed protein product [Caenorhabditis angaria]
MSDLVRDQRVLPDISKPKWDQSTYEGRARHFFASANPLTLFASHRRQEEARQIVVDYKNGKFPANLTVKQLWDAKILYDSTFHPDSGEKMFVIGRMSAQMPGNMVTTGFLLGLYRTTGGALFSHWFNQSFNAIVNYTNRSGNNHATNERLLVSYCCATGGAMAAALTLNKMVKNAHGLAARLVPFVAIALANAINIPMMRSNEITDGIELTDADGNLVAKSRSLAILSIAQVTLSRIAMATPYMVATPIIMNRITRTAFYKSRPLMQKYSEIPLQSLLAGAMLFFTTPLCCALFPQKSSIEVSKLEPEIQQKIRENSKNPPNIVYYNKGL